MRLSFSLAAVKYLEKKKKKKKKKKVKGRRSIVKSASKSAATCRHIPEGILVEILVRLPTNSLMRFKCVSRLWFSLISSRYFTNYYFNFSSSMRERVFVYTNDKMLFSSSSDATASLNQLKHDLTLPGIEDRLHFVNALRGLMCFRMGKEIRIINFTSRQVLNLPIVESKIFLESDYSQMWNYFGYDPVNDEYKVLTTISSTNDTNELRSETQILVLGHGTSWRNTKSSPPLHHPQKGISINGFLYYGAWFHENRCVVMSFDFNSEEFNLIELPMEYRIKWDESFDQVNLMNYQDQVAVIASSILKYTLELWVLEDAGKSKWSHKVLVLPCYQIRVRLERYIDDVDIRGTSRSGEVTLCGTYLNRFNRSTHAFFDLESNRITRRFVIEPPYSMSGFWEINLWDDVESIMYLEA